MSAISESRLPFDDEDASSSLTSQVSSLTSEISSLTPDDAARRDAVDPSRNVVLEASAGTGKTRVLVERYVNLLRAGVDPDHILAMTFTRKAAAEMRERIIARLREASRCSPLDLARWRGLKDRLGDISISTIDAFCLSLLREFPLEADVDPGFELADDTEVPRLIGESLDRALRICRAVARDDEDVALVFAQLGERRLRQGLTALLDRRLVAPQALRRYLEQGPRDLTAALACRRAAERLRAAIAGVRGGVEAFLADGPVRHPQFAMLAADIRGLTASMDDRPLDRAEGQAAFRALTDRLRAYFLTQEGRPREKAFAGTGFKAADCDSDDAWKRHRESAAALAPAVAEGIRAFRRDLNVVMSRGVWRIFAVALQQYQRTLESRALLDFSGVLERAVSLLKDMDEFSQSRFRLEARYRHVLVDEFQDTSRAQWALVSHLVRSWSEGLGAGADGLPPSIFIVGDRKQSIYGFRDADVTVLDEAAAFIDGLRADADPRRAISVSFRAIPPLLAFVNDLFGAIEKALDRSDAFRYEGSDRFPVGAGEAWLPPSRAERASASLAEAFGKGGKPDTPYGAGDDAPDRSDSGRSVRLPPSREAPADRGSPGGGGQPDREVPLGLIVADTVGQTAERVAAEIVRLFSDTTVRDRATGIRRLAQPADVAILFRSRDSHREFEKALERRGVSTYVYKGLGFFEADEVQDGVALLRYLADPTSNLRAAALLRSRIVRLSDGAIACLAPAIARALTDPDPPPALSRMVDDDRRVLERLRAAVPRWLAGVDRMTPTEMFGALLAETAYSFELGGARAAQARENLKKLRGMVARFQNRGYATIARVADHLEQLAVGDESNAALDARDSVSLMTVHAAKGLEFPIVFLVNFGRGTGGARAPIRVSAGPAGEASVAIADFQSEADADAQARDREETKRLLYVALTRARDRLYLSTPVEDEVCRMGRGSLGEVLPPSFRAVLTSAAAVPDRPQVITWTGPSGTEHRFVV